MRSSNKRSRSKSNRPKTLGNIVNRVFDSSGPEGKVRGTPQQIIEKYQLLARDAQLSNDRVAAENFQQHAEHYTRMLAQAQRELQAEQDARRQNQEQRDRQFQDERRQNHEARPQHGSRRHDQRQPDEQAVQADATPRDATNAAGANQDMLGQGAFSVQDVHEADKETAELVDTPESKAGSRPKTPRSDAPVAEPEAATAEPVKEDLAAESTAPAKPANRRKPRAPKAAAAAAETAADAPAKPKRAPRRPRKPAAEAVEVQTTSSPSSSAAE